MIVRKFLLTCGILSSLIYVCSDILAAVQWKNYSYSSQAISELMAINAPTRPVLILLNTIYGLLIVLFAFAVWKTGSIKSGLKIAGILLVLYAIVGQATLMFFPMHLRGEEKTITDTMHKILTAVTVLFILCAVGFGANADGRLFRFYSYLSILVLLVFGLWTGMDAPRIDTNLPTPWMGIKERINVYGFMLWVIVFAITLLQIEKAPGSANDRHV